MNEDKMPLFLINGFLEAGKTQFIKFTMQDRKSSRIISRPKEKHF